MFSMFAAERRFLWDEKMKKFLPAVFAFVCAGASAASDYDYLGTDSNSDGIRDDVENIVSSAEFNTFKTGILRDQAKVQQKIMGINDLMDDDEVRSVGTEYMRVMGCLSVAYMQAGEDPKFMGVSRSITEKTFNTEERNKKFHLFLGQIEGKGLDRAGGTPKCNK